jgi:hypothetical protein
LLPEGQNKPNVVVVVVVAVVVVVVVVVEVVVVVVGFPRDESNVSARNNRPKENP